MVLNLIKKYPDLLEIIQMSEFQQKQSLRGIFDRDITFNDNFLFHDKQIRPTQKDGIVDMDTVFNHLITEDQEVIRDDGSKYIRRVFEKDRAQRLHWLKQHVDEAIKKTIHIFSVTERDRRKRKDVIRTYIYNSVDNYVVVLEPQNLDTDYYLITAYHLNKNHGTKQMKKKMKKCLPELH